MQERKALRALLKTGVPFVAAGVYNPMSALIAQSVGFKAVHMDGHSLGDQLGIGEALTTMTEFVAQAASITKVIKVPLICDAGGGFGDAVNLVRCVREFEFAGASGIHIEDQVTPKRVSYHRGVSHVVPLEDFLVKLRVALEARSDPDFVIIARTDVCSKEKPVTPGSLQEVIRRCQAFVKAGADAIAPTRIYETPENLKILRAQVPNVPIVQSGLSLKEAQELGVQIVVPNIMSTLVVSKALQDYYKKVLESGNDSDKIAIPPETLQMKSKLMEMIGLPKLWKIEEASTERDSKYR